MNLIDRVNRATNVTRQASSTPEGWASSFASKLLAGAAACLALAPSGWSEGGTASTSATVRPGGPRSGTYGTTYLDVEGSNNGSNASFGVIDFNTSTFGLGTNLNGVSNLTLSLTESNASYTAPGSLNFYLSEDTTTDISSADTSLTYQTSAEPEGVGSQLSPLTLLGTGAFNTTGNVNSGQVDTYTLTLPNSVESYFLGQLNSGGDLRFVVTTTSSTASATFAGGTASTVATRPTLGFNYTVNQPTLTWKGGSGAWNPPGTAGDTSWSSGGWQSDHAAIFNVAGGGNVALTAPITAVGLEFDADGYTVSGDAGNSLTLTGGTVQVTNAGQTATVSAIVDGAAGLTKAGSGTLILSGQNIFQGSVTINSGALSISSDGNLGSTSNGIVLNNGTLMTGAAVTLDAGRTLSGSGTLDMTGGALTLNGTVSAGSLTIANGSATLNGSSIAFSSADVKSGSSLIINSAFTSSARTMFTDDGTVQLNADNSSYSGGVQMGRGTGTVGPTIILGSANALGPTVLYANGGALQSATDISVSTSVSLGGNLTLGGTTAGTTGAIGFTGGFGLYGTSKKTLTVNNTTTISGAITPDTGASANNSLNKAGPGRLIISYGTNTYNGGTTVTGGVLEVSATGNLGTGDINVIALPTAHVTLQIDNNNNSIDDMSSIILTSNGSFHGRLDLEFAGTETIYGLVIDGQTEPIGVYDATTNPDFISGTGSITVTALVAAPEPSSAWLMAAGALGFAGWDARRRLRTRQRTG